MPEPINAVITELVGLVQSGRYEEAEMLSRVIDRLVLAYLQYPGVA